MKTLSPAAKDVIAKYLQLPMLGEPINAPYFNNARTIKRGGLAATIGKGSPEELALEVELTARFQKFPLSLIDGAEIKKFLVTNNLGVDCSALVFQVLKWETWARGKGDFEKNLIFPNTHTWWRRFVASFRTIENTSVAVLGNEANSQIITKAELNPGDVIIFWNTGLDHKLNHILLVTETHEQGLTYAHSFRWRTDGEFDHGVRTGTISWKNLGTSLLEDTWTEKNKIGTDNETLQHAHEAERVELRRFRVLA